MTRRACALLLCILTLALSIPAGAVTLVELKGEVPERLTLEVEGPECVVSIDAPIILPEGDELPILRARPRKLDVDSAYAIYGLPGEDYLEGMEDVYAYHCRINGLDWSASERFVPDHLGGEANAIRVPSLEGPLDGNPLPWDAPAQLMQALLSTMGAGDADVRLSGQVAMSRPYQMEAARKGADFSFTARLDKPIEGREKGYYAAVFVQYLYGAPVFGEFYRYAPFGEATPYFSPCQFISSEMLSEQDFSVYISLLEPFETLSESAEMASFDAMRQTLETRIRSGELKDIESIELGYQMLHGASYDQLDPALQQNPAQQLYVLVPCWQVNGYDVKDQIELKNGRVDGNTEIPTTLEYASIRTKSGGTAPLALRIDARTGQIFRGEDFYQGN